MLAVGLNVDDVDPDSGVIVIRQTKYRKARRIPVQPTTVAALRRYSELRQQLCPRPTAPWFFVSSRGPAGARAGTGTGSHPAPDPIDLRIPTSRRNTSNQN